MLDQIVRASQPSDQSDQAGLLIIMSAIRIASQGLPFFSLGPACIPEWTSACWRHLLLPWFRLSCRGLVLLVRIRRRFTCGTPQEQRESGERHVRRSLGKVIGIEYAEFASFQEGGILLCGGPESPQLVTGLDVKTRSPSRELQNFNACQSFCPPKVW